MTSFFFKASNLEFEELKNQTKSYCCKDKACYGYGIVNYGQFSKKRALSSASYSNQNFCLLFFIYLINSCLLIFTY